MRLDDEKAEVKLTDCTEEKFEKIKAAFVKPFGFFDGNLYRIEVLKTENGVYMLCDFHHIVFDGGSTDIFLSELSAAYDGEKLSPETFTAFDLADEEAKIDGTKEYEDAKQYFDTLLKGSEATTLPGDKSSQPSGISSIASAFISKDIVDKNIRQRGITAANHFLSAAALAISRFAPFAEKTDENGGGVKVLAATINSGRDDYRLQRNFAMLIKTLPAVIDVPAEFTAEEFTESVQSRMFEITDNCVYPYVRLSSDYGFNTQIMYAYQGGVIGEHKLGGKEFSVNTFELDVVKFPVNITVNSETDKYTVVIDYDNGLFSENFIKNLCCSIAYTAQVLAENSDVKVKDICVTTPEELKKIEKFNVFADEKSDAKFKSLPDVFEEAATANPNKTALLACDRELTFAELDKISNKLANALISHGVKKGGRIPFVLSRTSNVLIAMLGIMKSGACYIPVDPDYPSERIENILSDSGAKFVITSGKDYGENTLNINDLINQGNETRPDADITPDDACYIIYTSGSTGKPKGVVISHKGIINYVRPSEGNRHVMALCKADARMVSVTTVSFDMFLKEAFCSLMNGLTLILADDEQSKDPRKLAELFKTAHGTSFNATPSRMAQYLELTEFADALKHCKVVMAGGEKYSLALYTKLRAVTDAVLINTYGPTEITVSCNAKILTDDGRVTAGMPLGGVVEQVMDLYGNPLPTGVTGELYIGGNGLAIGYFGDKAKTDAAFIYVNGKRYYKSGDLARWSENGEVEILGRNDGQIKLRGLRIELGEVENAILAIDNVKTCAVAVRKIREQEHLCAYYTASETISAEDLKAELSKTLARYMVPTAYLQMEKLPSTPNGKTDLKALPEANLMSGGEYVPPENKTEKDFCEIIEGILNLNRVGRNDNFFDIGGTSLLVTQLTIDAMERGYEISYGEVFANPSPAELAAICSSAESEKSHETQRIDSDVKDKIGNINVGADGYDYTKINAMLTKNNLDSLIHGKRRELGNICLSGATGFLGIHVLYQFLTTQKGSAYCIVRGGKVGAEHRLKSMLVYYFSNDFDELFGSRIVVVDGDVTNSETYKKLHTFPIDTYINCAANVKHFSAGTDIEDINVGGVKGAIELCKQTGARLIQVSTASVAGMSIDGNPPPNTVMSEQMFYFGQDISNRYVNSKFKGERLLLEACADGKLDAKIMRAGNLMARASDGEFQANFTTNSFCGRLKAYSIIGKVPYSVMGMSAEFAPIDCTADAILKLAQTPPDCRIFHPYNDHEVFIGDAIYALDRLGIKIVPCEEEDYSKDFSAALSDKSKAKNLNALIAYNERGKKVAALKSATNFTSQALLRLGFKWPITGEGYLEEFFKKIEGLGSCEGD
jgi:amino acid adenylation domain-containing protein